MSSSVVRSKHLQKRRRRAVFALRVYEVSSLAARCTAYLHGHSSAVVALVAARNTRGAAVSGDGTICVLEVGHGARLQTLDMKQRILYLCSTGPGNFFCLGSRRVALVSPWKMQNSKLMLFSRALLHGEDGRVHTSKDGRTVAMASEKLLRIAFATSEDSTATLRHCLLPTAVCMSRDGSMLAVGGESSIINICLNPAAMLSDTTKMFNWKSLALLGLCCVGSPHLFAGWNSPKIVHFYALKELRPRCLPEK